MLSLLDGFCYLTDDDKILINQQVERYSTVKCEHCPIYA
jgi:hypothetical protein